jgi:hypothetical protein
MLDGEPCMLQHSELSLIVPRVFERDPEQVMLICNRIFSRLVDHSISIKV